jgi:chemotaxis protein methyltransferase CheR
MPFNLPLNDSSLALLAELILDRTGIVFGPGQMDLLADKLAPLIAESGMHSAMDYYYLLRYDPQGQAEWERVQTVLAVNETYFWREVEQILAVANTLAPKILSERPGAILRIWHAACATGEEPYSMAIALEEAGCFQTGKVQIIATDFNVQAIEQARAGLYRLRSFRAIPKSIQDRYFTKKSETQYRIAPFVQERVQFQYLNLLDAAAMARMRGFDIIFCRNVFIYFSDDAIRETVEKFDEGLNADGTLFVAAAESLLRITNRFDLVEIANAFGYQKRVGRGLFHAK